MQSVASRLSLSIPSVPLSSRLRCGRAQPSEDQDSCSTIVLSGDSCCDAIVTFDLTSSDRRHGSKGRVPGAPRVAAASATTSAVPPSVPAACLQPIQEKVDGEDEVGGQDMTGGGGSERPSDQGNGDGVCREGVIDDDGDDGSEVDGQCLEPLPAQRSHDERDGSVTEEICVIPPLSPSTPRPCDASRVSSPAFAEGIQSDEEECPFAMPEYHRSTPLTRSHSTDRERVATMCLLPSPSMEPGADQSRSVFAKAGGESTTVRCPLAASLGRREDEEDSSAAGSRAWLTQGVPPSSSRSGSSLPAAATAVPLRRRLQPLESIRSLGNETGDALVQVPAGLRRTGAAPNAGGGRGGESRPTVSRQTMPSFDQMTVQELAGMMSVYGLKKKPKRYGSTCCFCVVFGVVGPVHDNCGTCATYATQNTSRDGDCIVSFVILLGWCLVSVVLHCISV